LPPLPTAPHPPFPYPRPRPQERCALLEAVAYDCQLSHQPDEARELFMAARRPRAALHIVNQQLSAAVHETKGAGARPARGPHARA
jgi:nuclear pore complex protein Nup93